ncbi:polysaccharide lyase family 8 super-sandwich domain-containing protein [Streptomyces sp. t39]|uniref:polysaccharide lyase family 8 super-sandwich domain-containing protein n=1 Tax=Streptomyces sp. t39 TaxID=1828156 RepID=UPI0011CDD50B|nr:polysaccharide lyase family 8 super-sandwich domain-containing protein [Streptomyces sp. t39]TXS57804.1 silent information regulator protein Sir2 [Streptomyces sp. t39]
MHFSRRALLSLLPTATVLAVTGPGAAAAPLPAAPAAGGAADRALLLANTLAVFAGTAESNARPEVAAKLAAVEATALTRLGAMDGAGEGEIFRGVPLGTSDPDLARTFQYLYEIALAVRAPGPAPSRVRGDRAVAERVIDALARLHDTYYGDQSTGYYGNWFTWEIGISTHVSKSLVLLRDEIAAHRPSLTAAYTASMDAYLRNGKDGDVDLDSRFHTGANLADITTNRILQGAVLGDDARITKAVADQLTVFATIDPYDLRHGVTDGFYEDGSFVQHASVAYTGSYGKGLLTRVVQTVKILDGTGWSGGGELAGTVRRWVTDGFAPLIHEGWMMEAVKGRGVSRTGTGYADTAAVVEAVVDLSAYVPPGDADALAGWVKQVHTISPAPPNPAAFVSPVSVARHADVLASSVPARDLTPPAHHAAFNAMDRTVHRRPGWSFALARSSERISKYEYMSGENLAPWFQGDGAHHLYLSGQDQTHAYGIDHVTVVDPLRLAGVTAPVERRRTVPELYGTLWYDNPERGFTASSEAQNTYVYFPRGTGAHSGGARLGPYGTASMVLGDDAAYAADTAGLLPEDFVTHRGARGTKSWFMLDDEIVVLAAGVGDPAGRPVTTTFDTRIADPGTAVGLTGELRGGAPWQGTGTAPLSWLRYADPVEGTAVGYVLLSGPPATAGLATVTRSRRAVRLTNPDTPVTKQVFTLGLDQPAGAPPASFAYALVPHATARRLRSYAGGPLTVLANTVRLQAVRHARLSLVAVNTFTPGLHRTAGLAVDGPASVLVRRTPDGATSLAVSDPTTGRDTVSVTLHGRRLRPVHADPGVRTVPVPGGTRVEVTTRHAYGRSLGATLRP